MLLEDLNRMDSAPIPMAIIIDDDITKPTREVADYLKEFGVELETTKEIHFETYEKILAEFGLIDDEVIRFKTYRTYA